MLKVMMSQNLLKVCTMDNIQQILNSANTLSKGKGQLSATQEQARSHMHWICKTFL